MFHLDGVQKQRCEITSAGLQWSTYPIQLLVQQRSSGKGPTSAKSGITGLVGGCGGLRAYWDFFLDNICFRGAGK